MRATIAVLLIALITAGVGSIVFFSTSSYYAAISPSSLHSYEVNYGSGTQIQNLGVMINVNVSSLPTTLFVGETRIVTLQISAENFSSLVENFSWAVFWFELCSYVNGRPIIAGGGNYFLNRWESSTTRLYRFLNISVTSVNINRFESAPETWGRIQILMDVYHNTTEYSFNFYTSGDIGPVAILSPLLSPPILSVLFAGLTVVLVAVVTLRKNGSHQRG